MVQILRGLRSTSDEDKSLKIEEERQRVIRQLKPKELTCEQKIRLGKLKEAKLERQGTLGMSARILGQTMSTKLYSNNPYTRFLIAFALSGALAVTLYPNFISSHMLQVLDGCETNFFTVVFLDLGSLAYLCFCSFIHFSFLNMSFIYAFNALEISKKAGNKSKKYYNEKVTKMAATISICITAFGIGAALFIIMARILLWNAMLATDWATKLISGTYMGEVISASSAFFAFLIHQVFSFITFIFGMFHVAFVKSNIAGRLLEWIMKVLLEYANPYLKSQLSAYVKHVIAVYEGSELVPTWRSDAIETVRFLVAYTTVFLLSVMLLFNFCSRKDKVKVEVHLRSYGVI